MDWFKWDEEGVDWRRVIPHKKRQAVGIDPAGALICTIAGQCGSPGCVLPDFHAGPCTPFAVPPGKAQARGKWLSSDPVGRAVSSLYCL